GKCDLAEKYYLMATLNNNSYAKKKINEILEKEFNLELAVKAENFLNKKNKKKINEILEKEFNLELAVKAANFLNKKNKKILNLALCYILNNKDKTYNSSVAKKVSCGKCKVDNIVIFLICGHPVCINCYQANIKCTICFP